MLFKHRPSKTEFILVQIPGSHLFAVGVGVLACDWSAACVACPDWLAVRAGVCTLLWGWLSPAAGVCLPCCDWLARVCDLELCGGVVKLLSSAAILFAVSFRALYSCLTLYPL